MSTQTVAGAVPEITVGHRIRIAREYAGLDQGELAGRAGISRGTIVNYENGTTTHMKPLYLRQIAMVTGVDAEWLASGVPSSGGGEGVKHRGNGPSTGFAEIVPIYSAARFRPGLSDRRRSA